MSGNPQAEAVALQALGWIVGEEERALRFLDATGCRPSDLRARAGDAEFLAAVLDFLLGDEAMVLAFAAETGLPPARAAQARAGLPGGALPHWT
jgi:hypothetical protein